MKILKYGIEDGFFRFNIKYNKENLENNIYWTERSVKLFVCKDFSTRNFDDGKVIMLNMGDIIYARNFKLRDNYMITLTPDATSGYLISEDEIKYYTIPIVYDTFWVRIFNETKKFGIKRKNNLFSFSLDIDENIKKFPYLFNYLKLICYVKTLINLEDSYVIEHFIGNILNILKDSNEMINNPNLSVKEKNKLMEETKNLMTKLYETIISISPLDIEKVVTSYALLDKYAKQDEEKKKMLKEETQDLVMKAETFKKNYLSTIKCKSSLIDDFNS